MDLHDITLIHKKSTEQNSCGYRAKPLGECPCRHERRILTTNKPTNMIHIYEVIIQLSYKLYLIIQLYIIYFWNQLQIGLSSGKSSCNLTFVLKDLELFTNQHREITQNIDQKKEVLGCVSNVKIECMAARIKIITLLSSVADC